MCRLRYLILLSTMLLSTIVCAAVVRQTRSAWIVTQGGADWPGGKVDGLTQRQRMRSLLTSLADRGFNSVFIQMQGRGDVAWDSDVQPMMSELSVRDAGGTGYDVAQAWIDECRSLGLECVAWVTTYSLGDSRAASRYAPDGLHPLYTHPELCVRVGDRWYLDPGNPQSTDYLMDLYRDLVYDYDFDGILFDDLYYPDASFDDAAMQGLYRPDEMPVNEWRRSNTRDAMDRLSQMVRLARPGMTIYAAAPGIYSAPDYMELPSATEDHGQDVIDWAESGFVDVVVPKLFHGEAEGFSDNLATWSARSGGLRILPAVLARDPGLMVRMDAVQGISADDEGGVSLYRATDILGDMAGEVLDIEFAAPAHLPVNMEADTRAPEVPADVTVEPSDDHVILQWSPVVPDAADAPIRYYSVYIIDSDGQEREIIHATTDTSVVLTLSDGQHTYAVRAVDRNNMMSQLAEGERTDGVADDFDIEFTYYGGIAYINSSTPVSRVDVHTLMGRNVLSRKVNDGHTSIDFNGYDRGVYVVRVIRPERPVSLYKVVI